MNKKKRRKRLIKAIKRRSKLIQKKDQENDWLKAWHNTSGYRYSELMNR